MLNHKIWQTKSLPSGLESNKTSLLFRPALSFNSYLSAHLHLPLSPLYDFSSSSIFTLPDFSIPTPHLIPPHFRYVTTSPSALHHYHFSHLSTSRISNSKLISIHSSTASTSSSPQTPCLIPVCPTQHSTGTPPSS